MVYIKEKSTIFVPENKRVVVPKDGILFGGDTSPDNLFAMYQPEGLLQWDLNFGPSDSVISVAIKKNGMNQTSVKVHRDFIINLRNASKKNYDETLDKFLKMIDEAKELVKRGR
jgi:hypothetical protein